MKYINEFRDSVVCKKLLEDLNVKADKKINIMEVCGTHTMSIFRYGLRELLPKNINLISGPGCPVCVTAQGYIDMAINLSKRKDIIITTFGDLMRIPGGEGTLSISKGVGGDIRVIYSPIDIIEIARENIENEVVFLAIGFETTTPIIAETIRKAKSEKINNISFLVANKKMPQVLEKLVIDNDIHINGFLLPGHVSSIIGVKPYEFLSSRYNIAGVISGFEPTDILTSIIKLVDLIKDNNFIILNNYERAVKNTGNIKAIEAIKEVFDNDNSYWRGFGEIKNSGYKINNKYEEFDAIKKFSIIVDNNEGVSSCRCGDILKGNISPDKCTLFNNKCNPENPIGPCMVSNEGACAAWYKYKSKYQIN